MSLYWFLDKSHKDMNYDHLKLSNVDICSAQYIVSPKQQPQQQKEEILLDTNSVNENYAEIVEFIYRSELIFIFDYTWTSLLK